ncbi:hypothetical protein RHSIM_Rhsim13G0215500 [Rhododendron simsii]|uniref:Uncharacterized protein n=1 Tax=Rhododendron simsii TaxID=118357 RepID=A0A834FY16_RHOSS|nr:hypothetical protein RHSIM_Rhsim13G0215500 [Rhododendron simsii]
MVCHGAPNPITVPHVDGLPHGAETTTRRRFVCVASSSHDSDGSCKTLCRSFYETPQTPLCIPRFGFLGSALSLHWVSLLHPLDYDSYEARAAVDLGINDFGSGISFVEHVSIAIRDCDAMSFKTCMENEGPSSDFIEMQFKKTVIRA